MLPAAPIAASIVAPTRRHVILAVIVAALGYFVDIYDLILFSIVRKKSLESLGVPANRLLAEGAFLLNMQMGGMLVGGVLWGILGDKKGRLSVLFGSILLYSIANIANGFVTDLPTYAALRFIAGVGLAGELGAGITLVSELLPRETRGIGTTIVASVGLLGAGLAWFVAHWEWTTAYFVGGGLGLALLALRIGVRESGLFSILQTTNVARGDFLSFFRSRARALRLLKTTLIGVPIWYAVGILVTFSPEIGQAMGMAKPPSAGDAVITFYLGGAVGDLASGLLSQKLKSRKRVVLMFQLILIALGVVYFTWATTSLTAFYITCFVMGSGIGYWALFVTMASEQFGTNLRSTATTSIPNFVRGAVVPLTLLFRALTPALTIQGSAIFVGMLSLGVALAALATIDETFGRDLNFLEEDHSPPL